MHDNATALEATTVHADQSGQMKCSDGDNLQTSAFRTSANCSPLQFFFDDLVSPNGQPTQAFRRVVCVPFQRADARARAALERKVRLLLLDSQARPRGLDIQAMANVLTQQGLRVATMLPRKSPARKPLFTHCLSTPFLIVSSDDSRDLVVVDAALREQLYVAPCTPAYKRTLVTTIPDIFIGSMARLQELVTSMSTAIAHNFADLGVDVPPWRRTTALLARWTLIPQHLYDERAQQGPCFEKQQGEVRVESRCLSSSTLRSAATPASELAAERSFVTPQEESILLQEVLKGMVHGISGPVAVHDPLRVVWGFTVGSASPGAAVCMARERDVWPCIIKPGGLASLCRKQGGKEEPGSSSDSIDSNGVLGASPWSVFQNE